MKKCIISKREMLVGKIIRTFIDFVIIELKIQGKEATLSDEKSILIGRSNREWPVCLANFFASLQWILHSFVIGGRCFA